jgi:Uma2 family endonuclease
MSTKTLTTVQEFEQMQTAETEDYELVDGELVPLPSATPRHGKVRDMVGHLLWVYFKQNPIGEAMGETDCRLAEYTVRRPDLAIFLGERVKQIDMDKIPVPFAPDIAVEVLSPSEKAISVRRKVRDYLQAGSQEVWLLDHANGEILVHTGSGIRVLQEKDALESPVLPGFSAAVADLVVNL